MRVLIIDNSRTFLSSLRRMLAGAIDDLEATEYAPDQRGEPPASFDWSLYDLLILSQKLNVDGDGLGWLEKFRGSGGFPPTLFLLDTPDVYVSAAAIKLGAGDVLMKDDITAEGLLRAVRETLQPHQHPAVVKSGRDPGAVETLINVRAPGRRKEPEFQSEDYEFIRLIGQGAMSRVYLTKRIADEQLVVVKTIEKSLLADSHMRERFVQEAEIACAISSEHVVKTYDYHISPEYGMISMEFLPGGDLMGRIQGGITAAEAIVYARQITAGIGTLWNALIVHRDLKPSNLMFRDDGQLAIADFGIAKRLNVTYGLTVSGEVLGTPGYMSPEQIDGSKVDVRSDLYAIGVILFEMLTGERLFRSNSPHQLMYQHIYRDAPKLPERLASVQPVLDGLLAKAPEDRFDDPDALQAALKEIPLSAPDTRV